jgi:DNA invertase Pin-like site-specific DNA recombinase
MVVPVNKKPQGVHGWAYLRISTGQGKQTTDTQRSSIEKWAAAQGVVIVKWFIDIEGKRWDVEGREEFNKMKELAQESPPDFIVAETRQRLLTNNPHKSSRYIDEFADLGVELWSTAEGCLSDGDLVSYIMGGVNDAASHEELLGKAHRALKARRDQLPEGDYLGGVIPYGADLVCFEDGQEDWRLVIEEHHRKKGHNRKKGFVSNSKKYQLFPDGTTKRFDGDYWPKKEEFQTLKLRPTILTERLDAIKFIFAEYATKEPPFNAIASELVKAGVKPLGGQWTGINVQRILENPFYVGLPVGNRQTASRFKKLTDDITDKPATRKGKPKVEKVDPKFWISVREQQFDPIVDPEVFEDVQTKLKKREKGSKKPRAEQFAIAELFRCGKCGERMVGYTADNSKRYKNSVPQYYLVCGTWQRTSRVGKPECNRHFIIVPEGHAILTKYLEVTGQKLSALAGEDKLEGHRQAEARRKVDEALKESMAAADAVGAPVDDFVRISLANLATPDKVEQLLPVLNEAQSSLEQYLAGHVETYKKQWEDELKEMEGRHTSLVEALVDTPKLARQKLLDKIAALEEDMERKKGLLKNLLEGQQKLWAEVVEYLQHVRNAQAHRKEGDMRAYVLSLKKLISKVLLSFRPNTEGVRRGSKTPAHILESVMIQGTNGDLVLLSEDADNMRTQPTAMPS